MSMTVKEIKKIISTLPDETPILISTEDFYEVETVMVEHPPTAESIWFCQIWSDYYRI